MNNQLKAGEKRNFTQKIAEFFFVIYLIALYFFNNNAEYVSIARAVFLPFAGFTGLFLLIRKRFYIGKNVMTAYMACAWMFASFFWAHNQYVAWDNIKTMWQIFVLFFLVYNLFYERKDAHEFFLKSLYIAGVALFGYTIYIYGFSEMIDMMLKGANVRLGNKISQANVFGMQHATTALVSFYYFLYKRKYKTFHIIAFAMAFVMAMSSGSRKALLMVCIGVLYLIYKKFGIRQVYKIIGLVAISVLIFIAVIQLPIFETIRMRTEGAISVLQNGVGDGSAETRMNMIKDGWSLFKERILMGYGATNYSVVSRYRTYAHNNFIEVLVDFGIIGFILYYYIYWNAFENLIRTKSDAGKAFLVVFAVRVMMEVAAVTYYDKLNWIILAFCLIVSRQSNLTNEEEIEVEHCDEKFIKKNC